MLKLQGIYLLLLLLSSPPPPPPPLPFPSNNYLSYMCANDQLQKKERQTNKLYLVDCSKPFCCPSQYCMDIVNIRHTTCENEPTVQAIWLDILCLETFPQQCIHRHLLLVAYYFLARFCVAMIVLLASHGKFVLFVKQIWAHMYDEQIALLIVFIISTVMPLN